MNVRTCFMTYEMLLLMCILADLLEVLHYMYRYIHNSRQMGNLFLKYMYSERGLSVLLKIIFILVNYMCMYPNQDLYIPCTEDLC